MRLWVFEEWRVGVSLLDDPDWLVDVSDMVAGTGSWPPVHINALLADWDHMGPALRQAAQNPEPSRRFRIADLRLRPVVPWPSKIVAAPVNYRQHQQELLAVGGVYAGQDIKTVLDYGLFLKAPSSLVGHGGTVELPLDGRRTDHEAEIAVVMGRTAKDVPPHEAMHYVAGFSGLIDFTVRGPEDRPFRKSFDGFTPLGPCLVTPDEVPDLGRWHLSLTVNGEVRQDGSTERMILDFARLVSLASCGTTLFPGDIIASGTPEGIGPVEPGDRVELVVDHIGRLAVTVKAPETDRAGILGIWSAPFQNR
ncbi:MAG: fumarylacetoacetate hydrolase family protein [Thermaerobacter sp.]|nr:fumarylacetoacetate hydrolase family protein [Thermaerobacter sp.]